METKLMIEELQQAYNEDVGALQEQINKLKTERQIECLKLENKIQYQRKQIEMYKRQAEESEIKLRSSSQNQEAQISHLQQEIKSKQSQNASQVKEIQTLSVSVKELRRQLDQKNVLLASKFRQFETDRDKRHQQELKALNQRLDVVVKQSDSKQRQLNLELEKARDKCHSLASHIEKVEAENKLLKEQLSETKKQVQFQNNEIDTYIKNLKQLERQKSLVQQNNANLHDKIDQQNLQIEKLLEEMKQQRLYIEQNQLHRSSPHLDSSQEEIRLLRSKLDEYSLLLHEKDNKLAQNQSQYLLKLKEIDDEKINTRKLQEDFKASKQQVTTLNQQILGLQQANQHLKTELANKVVQYNQLLARPPEHYEVKIQKTIDKKEYIDQLEAKVDELQKIINQLKVENSSYIEEIRKKVREEQTAKVREQSLLKSNQELKDYISSREKSLGWAVEREIMKDVQISHSNSSEKTNGYRVFVRHSNSQSEGQNSQIDVSGIGVGQGINFSVQSKLNQILEKNQSKSQIHAEQSQIHQRISSGIYRGMQPLVKSFEKSQGVENEERSGER